MFIDTIIPVSNKNKIICEERIYLNFFPDDYFKSLKFDKDNSWSINRISVTSNENDFYVLKEENELEEIVENISIRTLLLTLNKRKSFPFEYSPLENDFVQFSFKLKNVYITKTFCFINKEWKQIELNSNDFSSNILQTGVVRIIKRKKFNFIVNQ